MTNFWLSAVPRLNGNDSSCTSAVLAWLHAEAGVEEVIGQVQISSVNLAEVLSKVADRGGDFRQTRLDLQVYGLTVHLFSSEQAEVCAELRRGTRTSGLSLGGRVCLALGLSLQLTVLTADRVWADLDVGVGIVLLWP